MKKTYFTPQVEIVDLTLEDAILSDSGISATSVEDLSKGITWGDDF